MKNFVVISLMALLSISCNAQEHNKNTAQNNQQNLKQPSPKGSWNVTRKTDKNGNLVEYDSTYTWSSQNNLKGANPQQMDSLMTRYQSMFGQNGMQMNGTDMNSFFGADSTFVKQFMNGGLFQQDSLSNPEEMMKKMQERMAAMQQQFFQQQKHQPIIPADPKYNHQG